MLSILLLNEEVTDTEEKELSNKEREGEKEEEKEESFILEYLWCKRRTSDWINWKGKRWRVKDYFNNIVNSDTWNEEAEQRKEKNERR